MTTTPTLITVYVESEPHNTGVLLPATQGGAFLIAHRIAHRLPRDIWEQMKTAGAWYWSADDLEDMDMFDTPHGWRYWARRFLRPPDRTRPGWRYGAEAIGVLLRSGYAICLFDQEITSEDAFAALWTDEAKAART